MKSRGRRVCCNSKNSYKYGHFKRKSDRQIIQRFKCKVCKSTFSTATDDPAYQQNRRDINYMCMQLLASKISMRRCALILGVSFLTIQNKLKFLGEQARIKLEATDFGAINSIQFDELITFEHTKLKPLAVSIVVAKDSRKILGFEVAKMPATGRLAEISRKKYGARKDERRNKLNQLLVKMSTKLSSDITICSDECSFYKPVVKRIFPKAIHLQFKGKKSSPYGQGELKVGPRDEMFSVNHTFAMFRDGMSRLIRQTWCTTKKIECLKHHLYIYVMFHNLKLTS